MSYLDGNFGGISEIAEANFGIGIRFCIDKKSCFLSQFSQSAGIFLLAAVCRKGDLILSDTPFVRGSSIE